MKLQNKNVKLVYHNDMFTHSTHWAALYLWGNLNLNEISAKPQAPLAGDKAGFFSRE